MLTVAAVSDCATSLEMPRVDRPLISIVVCCYNRGHLIPQTLDSALAQSYEPFEIIVIDDGSTDSTPQVISSYGDRIRCVRQENQGIAVARTNGCKAAKGELIAFLDDDDLMPADRLDVLEDALRLHPECVFSTGDIAYLDSDGNLTGKRWLRKGTIGGSSPVVFERGYEAVMWPRVPATPHSTLFRRQLGEQIGWFNERYRYASEDKDFLARLARLGPIVYVPHIVSLYRRGHHSLTANAIRTEQGQMRFLLDHLQTLGGDGSVLETRLRSRICKGLCAINRLRDSEGGVVGHGSPFPKLRSAALATLGWVDTLKVWFDSVVKSPVRRLRRVLSM